MKKKLLLMTFLSLLFILSGCGKDKKSAKKTEPQSVTPSQKQALQQTTASFEQEILDNLIEHSDYISKVRIQTSDHSGINYNFINDYRGDLSQLELTLPKSLTPNRDYLIFYRDGEDGQLTPTRGEESYIEIQDDRDQSLQYIEEQFPLPESVNPNRDRVEPSENEEIENGKDTLPQEKTVKKSNTQTKKKTSTPSEKSSSQKKPKTDLKKD